MKHIHATGVTGAQSVTSLMTVACALCMATVLALIGCTGEGLSDSHAKTKTDSLTTVVFNLMSDQPDAALALVDSMKKEGLIGEGTANCRKAQIYSEQYQPRLSGIYAKHALEDEALKNRRGEYYFTYSLLINSALNVGDMQNGLKYATEAMAATRADDSEEARQYAPDFMASIASCQMKLDHCKEGNESYDRAWQLYEDMLVNAKSFSWFYPELMLTVDAIDDNSLRNDNATARQWLPRLQSSYERTVATTDIPDFVKDACTADMEIVQAKFYQREGNREEAERHYRAFQETDYATTSVGRRAAAYYLHLAERWAELEQAVASADSFYVDNDQMYSMGYLTNVLTRRFMAQQKQGRKGDALLTASKLIELLDSVEEKIDKDNTAELAVVYETQEKEQKIAQQEADLVYQRFIAMGIAFVLVVVFFIIYTLNRRAAARRLAVVSAQKERIDSELRIARDIQMSMVPGLFPQVKGLDLYASMTPAREVGGDLYGYLYLPGDAGQGGKLYFCVGDVSGKGIPASLFMAQATRLFLTLAKQQMMPADIAFHINEELTENNANGMFVTMFIALADLNTGQLDFCNCGHNPPVISTAQHTMHHVPSDQSAPSALSDQSASSAACAFLKMNPNAPIGLWPGLKFEGERIATITGQRLFVYTDGLNEAENAQQEQFGDERLLDVLSKCPAASSVDTITMMTEEVERFRGDAEPSDDLTMLCLIIGS